MMNESGETTASIRPAVGATDYVEFWPAGTVVAGRFRCAACSNETNVRQVLPRCGFCGECLWERVQAISAGR